jgi:hypothetical protein
VRRAEYTVYMEAETDAGGVSMAWGWELWARRGCVIREGSGGRAGLCFCAWGKRILLHEAPDAYATPTPPPPPRRLLPSHLHSVCQLALREGVRHVVHLPLPEGLLGYPLGEVVGLSATLLQCSQGTRSGMLAMYLRWRVCVRTGTSGVSLWLGALELAATLGSPLLVRAAGCDGR